MSPLRGHILIVDDEEWNRDMIRQRLAKGGLTFDVASNGEDACRRVESSVFDLVLLNIQMPLLSGLDVLKRIRERFSLSELPVILVTAENESQGMIEAFELGANDYLTKPITFPVALARIRTQIALRNAEAQRYKSEERYALAAAGSRDGIWDWDLRSGEVYFSDRWKEMLGEAGAALAPRPETWLDRIHADDRPGVEADLRAHLDGADSYFEKEYRILHEDGSYRWVLSRGLAIRDASNTARRIAGSQSDITSAKVIDPLTGMPNRVLFMDRLARLIARSKRFGKHLFAVLFIDVDRLKLVTDSFGHAVGDQLLVAFARRVESELRDTDTISRFSERHTLARHGGGEFTVLLDDLYDVSCAAQVAHRLLEILKPSFEVGAHEIFVNAHVGVAIGNGDKPAPDLLREAETALYHAKALGRERVQVFDSNMRQTAVTRLRTETDLRKAVNQQDFENWYQPIVSLANGRIGGLEALVRWRHQSHGLVAPLDFIPIAEETGLMVPIGEQVLREACQNLASWSQDFSDTMALSVSVNLSIRQIDAQFLAFLRDTIRDTGVNPAQLKLEITESLLMTDPDQSLRVLDEFRALDARVVMDDFGTGYSSLSYLKDFPLDELKIDRSFVNGMEDVHEKLQIVETILLLAQKLGLVVTAEGIETEAQLELLSRMGCEFGQGYYFSKPLSNPKITDVLRANPCWKPQPRAA